jgi:SAM-dependent methyltransferase
MSLHDRYVHQASWTRDLRAYLFDRVGHGSARRLLEVGCGTGAVLQQLETRAAGAAAIHQALFGLDLARAPLTQCRRHASRVHLAQADALALPFSDRAFDIAYCHFVLLWVDDPLAALREMKRVTSGHVLALAEPDYSHRVDAPSELMELGRLQTEALRRQGADVTIGSRLAELFDRAGLKIRETGPIEPWGGQRVSTSCMQAEWDMLEADLADTLSSQALERYRQLDAEARGRGARELCVPTYFAWGQV